ncbi:acyl carrier protein [Aquipseudomonas alcaligenes]|uniref:acyl carrier protein n=1 Tax=Aquipseudomonas alcaligenes TaxID=43263 RepID=UPI001F370084|nr:acyl carrier protein [Pseudomonas alcaligenes]
MDKQLQDAITQRRAVLDKLKDSLIDRLNLYQNRTQIDDDTPLFGSGLKLDSVDATELVVMLDEEFGVRVSEGDDPSYMRNVNSLANFILQRQAAAA